MKSELIFYFAAENVMTDGFTFLSIEYSGGDKQFYQM